MSSENTSSIRLFLSADLVGSTKLKNQLNHQELLAKYTSRLLVIEKLPKQDGSVAISKSIAQAAVLESLGVSTEDIDWATVVHAFYEGIHSEFTSSLEELPAGEISVQINGSFKPWKAVGDELIYEIVVRGRREIHHIVIAFLHAVREMDKKIRGKRGERGNALKVKGTAWVAGFPVRNREIKLPPDERLDFLGPDMDTGFRIGSCTRSGMLVVSVELAELLGECQATFAPMLGKIVGWEELKGVWNDLRYPVIWVDFPDSHPNASKDKASEFSQWDQEECRWCKVWSDDKPPKRQLSELSETLRKLRKDLPKSLGLVDPYIIGDPLEKQNIPTEHEQILELLKAIESHSPDIDNQDATALEREKRTLQSERKKVAKVVKKSKNSKGRSRKRSSD